MTTPLPSWFGRLTALTLSLSKGEAKKIGYADNGFEARIAMAHIIFWEKPGCAGNARQKALLLASGHTLDVKNLLIEPWDAERLRSFFGVRPVAEWFNRSSPRVKSGEVKPEILNESEALALMLAEPLLIRRPLMEAEGRREQGFDPVLVKAWLGLNDSRVPVTDTCVREAALAVGEVVPPCPNP